MKYFFDTEFIEHEKGVDLISIGIVDEVGRTFYAESLDFNPELADEWVMENVIQKLILWNPKRREDLLNDKKGREATHPEYGNVILDTNKNIAACILQWIGDDKDPVFYAYFASYDWVVLARLFGRLIDKPVHFPMWVIDLKQMMWERGLSKNWKREQCPELGSSHNAIADAKWNYELYKKIIAQGNQSNIN